MTTSHKELCDKINNLKEDNTEILSLYLKGLEIPIDYSCYFSRFLFWDNFALFAYYHYKKDVAYECFSKIFEIDMIPYSNFNRLIGNGNFYIDINPSGKLSVLMFKSQLNVFKNSLKTKYNEKVPNILHFIYIKGKGYDFRIQHYLAIKTAYKIMKWQKICIYNDIEPENNVWWELVKEIESVEVVKIIKPTGVNNVKILNVRHILDLMRLEILDSLGGVYMDLDMLTIKNFNHLIEMVNKDNEVCLVKENDNRLSNKIIIAMPNTQYIGIWLQSYYYEYVSEMYDQWIFEKTMSIANKKNPIILNSETFFPFNRYCIDFFVNNGNDCNDIQSKFVDSYGVHLWDTEQQKRNIIPMTLTKFMNEKCGYTLMFRKYIEKDLARIKTYELEQRIIKLEKNKNAEDKK